MSKAKSKSYQYAIEQLGLRNKNPVIDLKKPPDYGQIVQNYNSTNKLVLYKYADRLYLINADYNIEEEEEEEEPTWRTTRESVNPWKPYFIRVPLKDTITIDESTIELYNSIRNNEKEEEDKLIKETQILNSSDTIEIDKIQMEHLFSDKLTISTNEELKRYFNDSINGFYLKLNYKQTDQERGELISIDHEKNEICINENYPNKSTCTKVQLTTIQRNFPLVIEIKWTKERKQELNARISSFLEFLQLFISQISDQNNDRTNYVQTHKYMHLMIKQFIIENLYPYPALAGLNYVIIAEYADAIDTNWISSIVTNEYDIVRTNVVNMMEVLDKIRITDIPQNDLPRKGGSSSTRRNRIPKKRLTRKKRGSLA